MTVASHWVAFFASCTWKTERVITDKEGENRRRVGNYPLTVLKMGKSMWVFPPFPGDTPPTILVPYSMACLPWNVPCLPVNPWQMTRVSPVRMRFLRVALYVLLQRTDGESRRPSGMKVERELVGDFGQRAD